MAELEDQPSLFEDGFGWDDGRCVSVLHADRPATHRVILEQHGCERDGRWLPICEVCATHFAGGRAVRCMVCALDQRSVGVQADAIRVL